MRTSHRFRALPPRALPSAACSAALGAGLLSARHRVRQMRESWWSYDTPSTVATKMTYKNQQGLGGTFFWELSGDTANGELIKAID